MTGEYQGQGVEMGHTNEPGAVQRPGSWIFAAQPAPHTHESPPKMGDGYFV